MKSRRTGAASTDRRHARQEKRAARAALFFSGLQLPQAAASLSFLSGRTLTLVEAGFAANHCSSLVTGLMPLRFGLAGTLTAVIFSRPGRVKEPAPFLDREPATAPSSEASTARTSRAATPLFSDRCATRPDLLSASLIGFAGPGLAAD